MRVRGMGKPMKNDPCGTCTELRQKRKGAASGGGTQPPRNQRRTVPHLKGTPYPGNFAANNPPIKQTRSSK